MEEPAAKSAYIAGAAAVGRKKKKPPKISYSDFPNVYVPNTAEINPQASEESTYLIFNLKTSGGAKTLNRMIGIAACLVYFDSSTVGVDFNILVWCEEPMNAFVARISHHLTKDRVAREGWTSLFGDMRTQEVLTLFLAWIETKVPTPVTNIGLVAHNRFSCDYRVLATELACARMALLERLKYLCINTLSVMKC